MSNNKLAYEKHAKSFLALRDLLLLIIRQPALFSEDTALLKALKSQGGVAALETSFEEDGATKIKERMTINTMKAHANNVFEQGFDTFDSLRIAALDKVLAFKERVTASNKRTKAGLSKRTDELEGQLEDHQHINLVLLQGISIALDALHAIRKNVKPALLEKRAQDTRDTLLALLTMNPPPFNMPLGFEQSISSEERSERINNVKDMDDYRK